MSRVSRFAGLLIVACAVACVSASGAFAYAIAGVDRSVPFHQTTSASGIGTDVDYYGGPVMHSYRTHLIFWNPSNRSLTWDAGYQSTMATFLANVAADSRHSTNVMSLTGQYTDSTGHAEYNSTFAGSIQDTDPAPADGCTAGDVPDATMCLTDTQLRAEIGAVIAADHLPTGLGDIYLLATPRHFGTCSTSASTFCEFNQYCAYHTAFNTTTGTALYANQPYEAVPSYCRDGMPEPNGPVDRSITSVSHEVSEAVTDPLPLGPGNPQTGWTDPSNSEIGDLCASNYGPLLGGSGSTGYNQVIHGGHYFTQNEWSNEDHGCQPHDEINFASVTGASAAGAGTSTTFAGASRDPDGSIKQYVWNFGDGSMGVGATVSHAFQHSGSYTVTLVAEDVAGNIAAVGHTVDVGLPRLSIKVKGRTLRITVPLGGTVTVRGHHKQSAGAGTLRFKLKGHGKRKVKIRFVSIAGDIVTKTVKIRR